MGYNIAVADDDKQNLRLAERILTGNGFGFEGFTSGEDLLVYIEHNKPDLILLDIHMTGIDGFETMQRMQYFKNGRNTPVIFLTADDDADTETKALAAGAMDFVVKPFVASVLLLRVRNTIELIRLQTDLKAEVRAKTNEAFKEHERNERLSLQVVQTLAGTIDAKDKYTNGHSSRVAEYSREIAKRAGLSSKEQDEIYMMGLLHDVGKIGVPDQVINKPAKLTEEEYDIIKTHPVTGYDILKNITEMPKLAVGARWHHERYDGNGYPDGLSGTEIPAEARIIAVADAYDAMSSRRSYHSVFAQEFVKSELINGKGTQFDPVYADIMLAMIEEDKDYKMREFIPEELEEGEGQGFAEGSSEKMFTFLSMLDAGGINTALGMKYCMNDVNFYTEMLNEFTTSAPEREEMLTASLNAGDWEKYRVHVHSLRSVSKTIGADELSECARQLEEAAARMDGAYLMARHAELTGMLQSNVGSILMATSMYLM